jgi:ABC-type nitrate/sulfonate/bicarbonate transport system permease component
MSLQAVDPDTVTPTAARRRPAWRAAGQRTRARVLLCVVIAVVLTGWEIAVRTGVLDETIIAPPSRIFRALGEIAQDGQFRSAFGDFLWMIAASFLVGTGIAVLVGSLIGMSNFAYRVFHPFVLVWFATPNMVFLPLLVTIFGFGTEMKIIYGAISTMPSVLVTMIAGVRTREHRLVEAARSLGASRPQRLFKVVLPDVAPTIFTSAAYGLKHALLGVLIVELFSSQLGIGYLITLYTSSFRPEMVYAILLTVAALAMVLAAVLAAIERRLGRWRTSRTEVGG